MKNMKLWSYKFLYVLATVVLLVGLAGSVLGATYGIQTKTSGCLANLALPDQACTPGAIMTTSTVVICKVGYTKTVRDVSLATKKKVFKEYGIPWNQHSNYEVDHLISLELGGSNDISNLFPESYLIADGARVKDKLENSLHKQICDGKMSVEEAQKEISSNWVIYYKNPQATIVKPAVITATTNKVSTVVQDGPAVKMSTSKICNAKGTTYYNQTKNYKTYDSTGACLKAGGRLPLK